MNIVPYSNEIKDYLSASDVIDFKDEAIIALSNQLAGAVSNEIAYIKSAYEYVRDNISHSSDIGADMITCSATEVLKAGHGVCIAKSHLLAALLRCKSIPAGFCYQKMILEDKAEPVFVYHGLNGVYIREYDKWIRLDARGNKAGIDAQFSIEEEKLAFTIRPEKGEEDDFFVYPEPDLNIVKKLRVSKTRKELWDHFPVKLSYEGTKVEIVMRKG